MSSTKIARHADRHNYNIDSPLFFQKIFENRGQICCLVILIFGMYPWNTVDRDLVKQGDVTGEPRQDIWQK